MDELFTSGNNNGCYCGRSHNALSFCLNIEMAGQIHLSEAFFLEYERHPVLWDVTLRDFKNSTHREAAQVAMLTALGLPSNQANVKLLTTKIKYIRTKFWQELRKHKKSAKSGAATSDVYQPSWKYFARLSFLLPHVSVREGSNNLIFLPLTNDSEPTDFLASNSSSSASSTSTPPPYPLSPTPPPASLSPTPPSALLPSTPTPHNCSTVPPSDILSQMQPPTLISPQPSTFPVSPSPPPAPDSPAPTSPFPLSPTLSLAPISPEPSLAFTLNTTQPSTSPAPSASISTTVSTGSAKGKRSKAKQSLRMNEQSASTSTSSRHLDRVCEILNNLSSDSDTMKNNPYYHWCMSLCTKLQSLLPHQALDVTHHVDQMMYDYLTNNLQ